MVKFKSIVKKLSAVVLSVVMAVSSMIITGTASAATVDSIQTFATNATNSVLNNIFDPIIQFIKDLSPFAYVGVTIAVLVIGVMFLGGKQSREAAKLYLPWVFVGAVLIVGACTIGEAIPSAFTF